MRTLLSILILLALPFSIFAQKKQPGPPPVKTPFAESLQALVVTTADWSATKGTARMFERKSARSEWKAVGKNFAVVVGRSGLAWARDSAPEHVSAFKNEGDGESPAGLFPLTFAFGSAERTEKMLFPYKRLEGQTECVDDPNSTHYNKIVGRLQVGIFDWKSSEKMLEIGSQYELGVFVAYNSYPVVSGNGSCIFLHVWKDPSTPTAGCTGMEKADLERAVSWLDLKKNPYLVQLPDTEYRNYQKSWKLPKLK